MQGTGGFGHVFARIHKEDGLPVCLFNDVFTIIFDHPYK